MFTKFSMSESAEALLSWQISEERVVPWFAK